MDEEELETLESVVSALQPDVDVIRTEYSAVDPNRLFGRNLFDPERLGELAGWQRALEEARTHTHADSDEGSDHEHSHSDEGHEQREP